MPESEFGVRLSFRLKDLLGPVTRVKKKKSSTSSCYGRARCRAKPREAEKDGERGRARVTLIDTHDNVGSVCREGVRLVPESDLGVRLSTSASCRVGLLCVCVCVCMCMRMCVCVLRKCGLRF